MKMAEESTRSQHPDTSDVPRLSSVPRHIEEWLNTFFDGRSTVRFSCTPKFYERMYFRLREAASEHGDDPDLIVGLRGTLEFRRRNEEQTETAQDQLREDVSSLAENEPVEAEELTPDEYIAHLEHLRDEITRDSEYRQELACRAVAAGIKKTHVYGNSGITAPTLNKWLHDYTPEKNAREPSRLVLKRLQIVNTQIRSNTSELRQLATEAAIATGNVARVARAAGLSRQAIYRWLKTHPPTCD